MFVLNSLSEKQHTFFFLTGRPPAVPHPCFDRPRFQGGVPGGGLGGPGGGVPGGGPGGGSQGGGPGGGSRGGFGGVPGGVENGGRDTSVLSKLHRKTRLLVTFRAQFRAISRISGHPENTEKHGFRAPPGNHRKTRFRAPPGNQCFRPPHEIQDSWIHHDGDDEHDDHHHDERRR